MSALFIILVGLTMTRFCEKMLITTRCIHGFMSNLIKKSWTDSNLNGRDGQKAGRLFISGCIDRDGGWQIEHNSRILLILLSLFSKEEWRCVLFQFIKGRTLFRIYYWSLSESSQSFVCGSKQFTKGGRQNKKRISYQI